MPDTACVNAGTMWWLKNGIDFKKFNTFEYIWNLATELVRPFVYSRMINGLSLIVQHKRKMFLGTAIVM